MLEQAVRDIGTAVAAVRASKGYTQDQLAEKVGTTRTLISHLETGRKLPTSDLLTSICEYLEMPPEIWIAGTHPAFEEGVKFQEILAGLIGRDVSLSGLAASAQTLAFDAIADLLKTRKSEGQAHSAFNSILTFFGEKGVTSSFFSTFLGKGAFQNTQDFAAAVEKYQKTAIRLFGSFRYAFKQLRDEDNVSVRLTPLNPISEDAYTHRLPFRSIHRIAPDRLDDLGYISVGRVKKDQKDRQELRDKLRELAKLMEESPDSWRDKAGIKRINRINALLAKHGKSLPRLEETSLFRRVDSDMLRREADAVMPSDDRLAQIEETQQVGLRNLAAYLVEPYLDIYVATSMRERSDFVSVDNFVTTLFGADGQKGSPELENLHLRFFNPTQSWIDDRVAKGLVEALMLKRAALTIYMAQKGDTFGKDSEASVSLGQGKPVVVYVPKLQVDSPHIDSEGTWAMRETQLDQAMQEAGIDAEEGVDHQTKFETLMRHSVDALSDRDFSHLIGSHWADFDLYGELDDLPEEDRQQIRAYIDSVSQASQRSGRGDSVAPTLSRRARRGLVERVVSVASAFEKRAKTFREIHPLALQVILSTGVLNGIVVVRTPAQCAGIVRQLLLNEIQTELVVDRENYRLIEKSTGSVLRVISRNRLLTNSFWTHYFSSPPHR